MKPKILLLGMNGQIGSELGFLLPSLGNLVALDRRQADLSHPESIRKAVREIEPALIVNAAAFTQVDNAEKEEETAHRINAIAPAILAEEAKRLGALLLHYSTDYVFDGTKRSPYCELDPTNPISAYGRTKLAGEQAIQQIAPAHLIFRTAWIYARAGKNFLRTILRLATEREELRIVRDQFGAPTWAHEVARATSAILSQLLELGPDALSAANGVYHMTAAGECTWFDFTLAILQEAQTAGPENGWFCEATNQRPVIAKVITPITSAEFPTPARRPGYSVLSNDKLHRDFSVRLPEWREQLRQVFTTAEEPARTAIPQRA